MLAGRTSLLCAQIACLNRQPCAISRHRRPGRVIEREGATFPLS